MTEHIRLGAFLLETPLSSGGMGTVWRARHEVTDSPVAVKVIAGAYAQDPMYLEGFEREVRAVAGMQHPRIIRVYDFGFVDSAAERSSNGKLPRRSPWLAMELASHGSLAELPGVGDWETLKAILFDILDALAHSHARGIVHRDLKPGNVLLTRSANGVHCKLTDFGISHVSGRSISTREVFASSAGTPWYMAPEQVESRWRDYGPWTDLYALGCVAYQLASGQTPFVGESAVRVARQQLFDRPPPLDLRVDAPAAFRAWVDRLLVKEIPHRFRRAADAAWALHQISPRGNSSIRVALRSGVDDTASGTNTTDFATKRRDDNYDSAVATLTFLTHAPAERTDPLLTIPKFSMPGSLLTFSVPPVPETWRQPSEADEAWLPGSGLGLYRLREIPFVGRESERDLIWATLRKAVVERKARAIVIRGSAGSGKSRLCHWMAQRAHELGTSVSTSAVHSPLGGPSDGVAAMFQRYLNCGGLDFERAYLRLRRLITSETTDSPEVGAYHAAVIARYIHPTSESQGVPAVRFTSADERYHVAKELAAKLAGRRAVVCVLDDVQWGYDALEFASRLIHSAAPVLLLLTVRPDQLATRPLESEALREFEAHEAVTTLDLGPLTPEEHRALVDELLSLEPTLREEVMERTAESPLFATELLGDWVRRRVLRASPQGFRLDATEQLPPDLYSLWNRRLDLVLDEFPSSEDARAALEIGAMLGTAVADQEWRAACSRMGITIPGNLVERLVATAIITPTDVGWAFKHQMLRESIAEAAALAGRATAQHKIISEMLEFDESPDNQLRRAFHNIAVGDAIEAAQPLITAMEAMIISGRNREAMALLSTLESVFDELPEGHKLRKRAFEAKLSVLRRHGEIDRAMEFIARVRPIAASHGWQSTLADFARTEGIFAIERGDLEAGRELLRDATNHARLSRSPSTLADSHQTLGMVAVRFGDLEIARAHFEAARDHYQMASRNDGLTESIAGLAEVERLAGNFAAARRHNDEAVRICRQFGYRVLLAAHLNRRGEIAAAEGDYKAAHRHYLETLDLARLTNNSMVQAATELNVGISLIYLERAAEAASHLASARAVFDANGPALFAYFAELGLLWAAAFLGDTDAWDAKFPGLSQRASHDLADRDSVLHALRSGDRWLEAADAARATAAFQLARALLPSGFAAAYDAELAARLELARALGSEGRP